MLDSKKVLLERCDELIEEKFGKDDVAEDGVNEEKNEKEKNDEQVIPPLKKKSKKVKNKPKSDEVIILFQ